MMSEMSGWLQMQERLLWHDDKAFRARTGMGVPQAPRRRAWRRTVRRAA
jgi:hypothetical protein